MSAPDPSTGDEVLSFFKANKLPICSAINVLYPFIFGLRENKIISDKEFKECRDKVASNPKSISETIYDVLQNINYKVAIREIFCSRNLDAYPDLKPISQKLDTVLQHAENSTATEWRSNEVPETQASTPESSAGKRRKKTDAKTTQSLDFKGSTLPVCCGKVEGVLYKEKLAAGSSEKCIKGSDGKWFTPTEFETKGGYKKSNNWKQSICCGGERLRTLIAKGELPNPPREYPWKKKAKVPSWPVPHSVQFQLADTRASAAAAQGPSSPAGKRASQSQDLIKISSPDPTSSSPTPVAFCGGSPEWATPSPPQGSPSEAAPVPSQVLNGTPCRQALLMPEHLPPSVAAGASNSPLEPLQEDLQPIWRTPNRNSPLYTRASAAAAQGPSSAAGKRASQSQHLIKFSFRDPTSSSPNSVIVLDVSPEWATPSPPQGSPTEATSVRSQQPRTSAEAPQEDVGFDSDSDKEEEEVAEASTALLLDTDTRASAAAAQGPSSPAGKRASQSQDLIKIPSPDPTSSPTPVVVCSDSLEWATPSAPQGSPSEAAPVPSQVLNGTPCQQPLVMPICLPPDVAAGASNSPLESPLEDPQPVRRTSRRKRHLSKCFSAQMAFLRRTSRWKHHLSSSLGFAILSGQCRMEKLFKNTLGSQRTLRVKLQDIQGHLSGLKRQQEDLLQALNQCSQRHATVAVSELKKQMKAITSHQQLLQTSVQEILTTLGQNQD